MEPILKKDSTINQNTRTETWQRLGDVLNKFMENINANSVDQDSRDSSDGNST